MTKSKAQKIQELLTRGIEEVIVKEHLEKRLLSGKKLRVKHGIDPTGPMIHIGRAVQLWKLKAFQDLGHEIVLIIGDFTAQIGDASDKLSKRPILTKEQVKKNMKNYLPQIGKILDLNKVEVHYNSEWHQKLSQKDLLALAMFFTAQQMIQRRNFKERWDAGKEIGLHELSYPLLQGYDSVAIKADVEIGGSDQLFNLKVGRKIQEIFTQEPQDIMTTKMLIGLDGRKMSTSWGNVVNISDGPDEMFGKIMSMHDELMPQYFELATKLSLNEIKKIFKQEQREAKARLAREIVALYQGKKAAEKAEKEFNRVFKEKSLPKKIPIYETRDTRCEMRALLVKTKLASSKSEARRLVEQGGVKINGQIQKDWQGEIKIKDRMVIQVGKRKFVRLKFSS